MAGIGDAEKCASYFACLHHSWSCTHHLPVFKTTNNEEHPLLEEEEAEEAEEEEEWRRRTQGRKVVKSSDGGVLIVERVVREEGMERTWRKK